MRLEDAVAIFLAEWPAEGVSEATLRTYGQALMWFVAFASLHGVIDLAQALTPSFVRTAIRDKMDQAMIHTRSPNYKGGQAAGAQLAYATRRLARWLIQAGVEVDDLSSVKPPRVPQHVQTRLYPDEFEALESAILHRLLSGARRIPRVIVSRDLALINLLGETGLRAAEVCHVTLLDLSLEQGWLLVHGKGGKDRVLSIIGSDGPDSDRVARLLRDWIEARSSIRSAATHNYLWTSAHGRPLTPDELRKVLARICAEAGLPSNRPPHAFRRYVFTEHYRERPGSIRRLAARMGWSEKSHKMISVYTHGVELELAREPMPLLSTRHRHVTNQPFIKVLPDQGNVSSTITGAGPPSGDSERPGPARPMRNDRNRAASQAPRRGPAPSD